ncbi:serine/threonine-protein kinase [Nocardioides sp. 1609]|uniref:serine/threonine-protein kinase n=1 Tax=Nocardioides sp. 1609 TaxID=2508327 RepID=UPI0010704811|nr:serine/threonine-protein kinase [Nocardioides sp. 1609]
MPTLPVVGDLFGRYRIDGVIGRGGMGVVFEATDSSLDRRVALKVVSADLGGSAEFLRRFEREAAVLARLDSPHVIAIFDYGTHDDVPYIATQYVGGGDLGAYLSQHGPLTPAAALRLCAQVADALDDAHRVGVVHRDVKPTNVLLRGARAASPGDLHVYLCDFGIARTASDGLTAPGAVAGTWSYLSPESGRGAPGTPSSDLYALGCLLWATLTGLPPYRGTDIEIAIAHQRAPVRRLPGGTPVLDALNDVLARSMAKDPADRFPDADRMRTALLAVAGLPGADAPLPPLPAEPTPTGPTGSRPPSTPRPSGPPRTPPPGAPPGSVPPGSVPPGTPPPAYQSLSFPSSPQEAALAAALPGTPPGTPPGAHTRHAQPGGRRTSRRRTAAALAVAGVVAVAGIGYVGLRAAQDDDPAGGGGSGGGEAPVETAERPITGDLDGDGFGDLSATYSFGDPTQASLISWRSDGAAFSVASDEEVTPAGTSWPRVSRIIGHVDDDDITDTVLFTRESETSAAILTASPSGGGDDIEVEVPDSATAITRGYALADTDGDGIDDLYILELDEEAESVEILESRFDGTSLATPVSITTVADRVLTTRFRLGDVDGDRRADLLMAATTDFDDTAAAWAATVSVRLGDGEGGFAEAATLPDQWESAEVFLRGADVDGDGDDEVVVVADDLGNLVVSTYDFTADGALEVVPMAGGFGYPLLTPVPPEIAVVDVDGDGADDLVLLHGTRPGGPGRVVVAQSREDGYVTATWYRWKTAFPDEERDSGLRPVEESRWY